MTFKWRPIIGLAIIFVLTIATLSGFSHSVSGYAQTNLVKTVVVTGGLVLASYAFDICSEVSLGNCPVSVEFSEQYSEPVTLQAMINSPMLMAGETESTQIYMNPGQPNLVLQLGFSVGTSSYNYSIPLPIPLAIGSFTYTIPLTQIILSALVPNLGLPSALLNLLGFSLNLPITLESNIQAEMTSTGFSSSSNSLTWDQPGTISYSSWLTGTSDDSYLRIKSLGSNYSLGASLVLGLPIVGDSNLFSFQTDPMSFGLSPSILLGEWYHVTVSSQYSQASGSGWYLSGSTVTLGLIQQEVASGTSQFEFDGWTGSGAGSYSGTQTSPTLTVAGPITETATWSTVQNSPFGQISLGDSVGFVAGVLFVGLAISGIIGAILLVAVTRRHPRI